MSEQYFSGVKKGDRIWTIESGLTEVNEVCSNYFITTQGHSYGFDGRFSQQDFAQAAFWSDPQIVAPPRPKRMVKKVISGVEWRQENFTFPHGGEFEGYWSQFVGKGPMTMTLEWEE